MSDEPIEFEIVLPPARNSMALGHDAIRPVDRQAVRDALIAVQDRQRRRRPVNGTQGGDMVTGGDNMASGAPEIGDGLEEAIDELPPPYEPNPVQIVLPGPLVPQVEHHELP